MPIPKKEAELQSMSVKEMVYEKVRDWIIEGVLEPGEKISDKEIAEHFSVSKTPVREAFQILESQRLIKTYPRKETRVTELETNNIEEWYLPIIVLEDLAISLACDNITGQQLKKLEILNDEIQSKKDSADALTMMYADKAFHNYILEIAGNQYVSEFLAILQIYIQRFEFIFFKNDREFGEYGADHEKIIEALRQRDKNEAVNVMKKHWTKSMERLKELLASDEYTRLLEREN